MMNLAPSNFTPQPQAPAPSLNNRHPLTITTTSASDGRHPPQAPNLYYSSGKRAGLPRPCSSCRLRRIRCIRPEAPESPEPCLKCDEKGIRCTVERAQKEKPDASDGGTKAGPVRDDDDNDGFEVKKKRKINRDGDVIRRARERFGRAENYTSPNDPSISLNEPPSAVRQNDTLRRIAPPSSSPASAAGSVSPHILSSQTPACPTPSSTSSSLSNSTLQQGVTYHLLSTFFTLKLGQLHIVKWDQLRKWLFEVAGGKPSEMGYVLEDHIGEEGSDETDWERNQYFKVIADGDDMSDDDDEEYGLDLSNIGNKRKRIRRKKGGGQSEVLVATLIAIASRVSDCPAVLGMGASRLQHQHHGSSSDNHDLEPSGTESDLSEWGQRHEAVSQALLDRAVKLADRKGTFRKPSLISLVILVLFSIYCGREDPNRRQSRIFLKLALDFLRIMKEEQHIRPWTKIHKLAAWTAFCSDTSLTSRLGCAPNFTPEDREELLSRRITLSEVLQHVQAGTNPECDGQILENGDPELFWSFVAPYLKALADIGYAIYEHLTGPRSFQNPLSASGLRQIVTDISIVQASMPLLIPALRERLDESRLQDFPRNVIWFMSLIRSTWIDHVFVAKRAIGMRRNAQGTFEWDTTNEAVESTGSQAIKLEIRNLLQIFDRIVFDAARQGISVMNESCHLGKSLGMFSTSELLCKHIPQIAYELSSHLPSDMVPLDSTDSTFDSSAKIEDMNQLIECINLISWSNGEPFLPQTRKWLQRERDGFVLTHALRTIGGLPASLNGIS